MAQKKLNLKDSAEEESTLALNNILSDVALDMQIKTEETERSKENETKYKQVNIRLTVAEYEQYQKLFGSSGNNMSAALRMCADFVYHGINRRKLKMTRSGILEETL